MVKTFKDADGQLIRVSDKKQDEDSLTQYSRAGFNREKTQVLIFNGQAFLLYEKTKGAMNEIARCEMWIS